MPKSVSLKFVSYEVSALRLRVTAQLKQQSFQLLGVNTLRKREKLTTRTKACSLYAESAAQGNPEPLFDAGESARLGGPDALRVRVQGAFVKHQIVASKAICDHKRAGDRHK